MASLPPELPRDPETLQAMLIAREAEIARLRQIIKELQRHRFGDGRVEIDSNTVERSIRPLALTRKNALFRLRRRSGPLGRHRLTR